MKYYKVLNNNHESCNGGKCKWIVYEWMPEVKGKLIPCNTGYHLCRKNDIVHWLNKEIWVAEGCGQRVVDVDKVVFSEARITSKLVNWNECTARLFACDCAEHLLHLFEKEHPSDGRPRQCINVSRRFARGNATQEELDVARVVAGVAAQDATNAAGRAKGLVAWGVARAARATAWHTPWDAVYFASGGASFVGGDVEKKWQTKQLFKYLRGELK